MDVRSLLKQVIIKLTGPAATYPEEYPMDSWEDTVIRLALQHWIRQAGCTVPNWDQFRRIIEIGIK
jgi:hypothetical protein